MDLADLMVWRHEQTFGEGSWAELEADVRKRHSDVFVMLDLLDDDDEEPPRKWWQFWK